MSRMALVAGLFLCSMGIRIIEAGPANLVLNGRFERGKKNKDTGRWEIPGWHLKLADFMPQKTTHEDGSISHRYICGCGQDLGSYKPWVGLVCSKCGGFLGGEEYGDWYLQNDEYVSLGKGSKGRGVKFTISKAVGDMQGVRVWSRLIRAKRGWGYKLSFDARSEGVSTRVFVEGFRYKKKKMTPEQSAAIKDLDRLGHGKPLERIYRAHVNCRTPGDWQHFTKDFVPPKRYHYDWMSVKLYGYIEGKVWFDNVKLVPMTKKEYAAYIEKKSGKVKDKKHFAY